MKNSNILKKLKNISSKLITFVVFTTTASQAFADEFAQNNAYNQATGIYIYGGVTAVGGAINVGYLFNQSVGLEFGAGAAGYGVGDASIIHLAVVGNLPIGARAQLTGKVGYAVANSKIILDPTNNNKLHSSLDFGLGINYFFTPHLAGGINVDTAMYTVKNTETDMSDDQFAVLPTIGVTYFFN